MARLDIRVDGRTRVSRTVDDAVVAAVLKASEPVKVKAKVRNFQGTTVKQAKAKAEGDTRPGSTTGDVPEKSLGGTTGDVPEKSTTGDA